MAEEVRSPAGFEDAGAAPTVGAVDAG